MTRPSSHERRSYPGGVSILVGFPEPEVFPTLLSFPLPQGLRHYNFGQLILTDCPEVIKYVFNSFSFRTSSLSLQAGHFILISTHPGRLQI